MQGAEKLREAGLASFQALMWEWIWLVLLFILLDAVTDYVARNYGFEWREAMTHDYIPRLKNTKITIEGESQRVQEDPKDFAEILASLGMMAIKNLMTLVAFLGILWDLSKGVRVDIIENLAQNPLLLISVAGAFAILTVLPFVVDRFLAGKTLSVFKIVLACCLLTALYSMSIMFLQSLVLIVLWTSIGGIAISKLVGIKLPYLEYDNQVVEAAFRKESVLGEGDRKNHTVPEVLFKLFREVKYNYRRLYLHYGYFDLWKSWYGLVIAFIPAILLAPNVFLGVTTVGVLFAVENVFGKVHYSFAFILYNWPQVTKFLSIQKRLHEFEANLDKYQVKDDNDERGGNKDESK